MKYRMTDGKTANTETASQSWESVSITYPRQRIYRTRQGRYFREVVSWQGSHPEANWLSREDAARWLSLNGHNLPDDLQQLSE